MRRPPPERVREILRALQRAGGDTSCPSLVAQIQRETGCSRATAYRAIDDALAAGTITPAGETSHVSGADHE